ncbi:MAG: 2-amino-4-hydroxy-6-hydroxymethyldihydropteridine diphosphokinase [Gemmatimonadaceae bacterium]|nr:2-amino-4-hydroxy-6-hydroxymethyldihydropteridine diphosphokinase [Gemmatimonadaceae bacterium]
MTTRAVVALGSNLGDRAAWLVMAHAAISLLPSTSIVAASSIEETAPVGGSAQGPYLNQMLDLACALAPLALLEALQAIERRLGRVRRARWGARTIDLDLVRYGTTAMQSRVLTLPHPGLATRAFWRRELAELDAMSRRVE